jgi:hypothetical protein
MMNSDELDETCHWGPDVLTEAFVAFLSAYRQVLG